MHGEHPTNAALVMDENIPWSFPVSSWDRDERQGGKNPQAFLIYHVAELKGHGQS